MSIYFCFLRQNTMLPACKPYMQAINIAIDMRLNTAHMHIYHSNCFNPVSLGMV